MTELFLQESEQNDRLTKSVATLTSACESLVTNNKTLTEKVAELSESLATVTSDKQSMEKRLSKQVSNLKATAEGKLKRKSSEMDDVDSQHVEELRQRVTVLRKELYEERRQGIASN